MKKVITLSIVSILAALAFTGCQGTSPSTSKEHSVHNNEHFTQEKMHTIIKQAGEENGWKMTEFKNNAIIAEKIDGDNSKAVTITFSKSSFSILPEDSSLKSAINNALGK